MIRAVGLQGYRATVVLAANSAWSIETRMYGVAVLACTVVLIGPCRIQASEMGRRPLAQRYFWQLLRLVAQDSL
jgi:hypothetical protein